MKVFIQISSWIFVPVILGVFIGNYLDAKYDTQPWIVLSTLTISFIITGIKIVKISKEYIKSLKETNDPRK